MISLIEKNQDALRQICESHHVTRLWLFGSAVKGEFDPVNSDLDIVVEFANHLPPEDYAENYFSLLEALEKLYGKKVELLSRKALKNPVMIREIEDSKVELYAA